MFWNWKMLIETTCHFNYWCDSNIFWLVGHFKFQDETHSRNLSVEALKKRLLVLSLYRFSDVAVTISQNSTRQITICKKWNGTLLMHGGVLGCLLDICGDRSLAIHDIFVYILGAEPCICSQLLFNSLTLGRLSQHSILYNNWIFNLFNGQLCCLVA